MDEVRIVLLGKQGAGKSAAGNTLLGSDQFHTAASTERVTKACAMHTSTVDNQNIKVVDTPGWPDSLSETEIKWEIIKCFDLCSPGPHVFFLVLPIGRFTNEEINTYIDILKEFGVEAFKHMLLLFTKGDDLDEKPIEVYLENVHQDLQKMIQMCNGRYHVFNNRDKNNQSQVSSLLNVIKKLVEKNNENFYTMTMYQNVKKQQRAHETCWTKEENLAPTQSTFFKDMGMKEERFCETSEKESEKTEVRAQSDNEEKVSEMMMLRYESNRAHIQDDEQILKITIERLEKVISTLEQQLRELQKNKQVKDKQFECLEDSIKELKEFLSTQFHKEDEKLTARAACCVLQ